MILNNEKIISSQPEIYKPEFDLERGSRSSSIKIFRSLRYWCIHEFYKKITVEEFDQLAINNFPSSFLWLLRECASMLRASPKELYFELIFVEIMLSRLYPEKFVKKSAMRIDKSQW